MIISRPARDIKVFGLRHNWHRRREEKKVAKIPRKSVWMSWLFPFVSRVPRGQKSDKKGMASTGGQRKVMSAYSIEGINGERFGDDDRRV